MNRRHWRVYKSPNTCNHPSLFLFHIPTIHWPLAIGQWSSTFYIFSTNTYDVSLRACMIFFAPIYHIPHSQSETLTSPSEPGLLVTKSLHTCLYLLSSRPGFLRQRSLLPLLLILLFIKKEGTILRPIHPADLEAMLGMERRAELGDLLVRVYFKSKCQSMVADFFLRNLSKKQPAFHSTSNPSNINHHDTSTLSAFLNSSSTTYRMGCLLSKHLLPMTNKLGYCYHWVTSIGNKSVASDVIANASTSGASLKLNDKVRLTMSDTGKVPMTNESDCCCHQVTVTRPNLYDARLS